MDEITEFLLEAKRIQNRAVDHGKIDSTEIYRTAQNTRLMINNSDGEMIIDNGKIERRYLPESKYIFKKKVAKFN